MWPVKHSESSKSWPPRLRYPSKVSVTMEEKGDTIEDGLVSHGILRLHVYSVVGWWCILQWVMRGMVILREHLVVVRIICLEWVLVRCVIRISDVYWMRIDLNSVLIVVDMVIFKRGIVRRDVGHFWRRCVKCKRLAGSDGASWLFHRRRVESGGRSPIVLRWHWGTLIWVGLHRKCVKREHGLLRREVDLTTRSSCIDGRIRIWRPKHLETRLHLVGILLRVVEGRWYVHRIIDSRWVIGLMKRRIFHLWANLRVWVVIRVTLRVPFFFRWSDFNVKDVSCSVTKG